MRNTLIRCVSAMVAIILVTLSVSITSKAELATHYDNTEDLYLTAYELYIEQGNYDSVGVHATNYVSYFVVGAHSKDTYVVLRQIEGGFNLEVHVGRDETANGFMVYIYLDGTSDYHKDLYVGVKEVYTYNPDSALDTSSLVSTLQVPYVNSTTGILTLINDYKTGFFYTADGLPIAQFSVYADNGQIRVLQLGEAVDTGNGVYITVNTTTAGTIHISESDKVALQLFGVNGIILNGVLTPWP